MWTEIQESASNLNFSFVCFLKHEVEPTKNVKYFLSFVVLFSQAVCQSNQKIMTTISWWSGPYKYLYEPYKYLDIRSVFIW